VRSAIPDALLALWLAVSAGFWLFGFAFTGGLYLPALNAFTLVVSYLPWLVLAGVAVVRWRSAASYGDKKPKV
jgi:hypothetical protein